MSDFLPVDAQREHIWEKDVNLQQNTAPTVKGGFEKDTSIGNVASVESGSWDQQKDVTSPGDKEKELHLPVLVGEKKLIIHECDGNVYQNVAPKPLTHQGAKSDLKADLKAEVKDTKKQAKQAKKTVTEQVVAKKDELLDAMPSTDAVVAKKDELLEQGAQLKDQAMKQGAQMKDAALKQGAQLKDQAMNKANEVSETLTAKKDELVEQMPSKEEMVAKKDDMLNQASTMATNAKNTIVENAVAAKNVVMDNAMAAKDVIVNKANELSEQVVAAKDAAMKQMPSKQEMINKKDDVVDAAVAKKDELVDAAVTKKNELAKKGGEVQKDMKKKANVAAEQMQAKKDELVDAATEKVGELKAKKNETVEQMPSKQQLKAKKDVALNQAADKKDELADAAVAKKNEMVAKGKQMKNEAMKQMPSKQEMLNKKDEVVDMAADKMQEGQDMAAEQLEQGKDMANNMYGQLQQFWSNTMANENSMPAKTMNFLNNTSEKLRLPQAYNKISTNLQPTLTKLQTRMQPTVNKISTKLQPTYEWGMNNAKRLSKKYKVDQFAHKLKLDTVFERFEINRAGRSMRELAIFYMQSYAASFQRFANDLNAQPASYKMEIALVWFFNMALPMLFLDCREAWMVQFSLIASTVLAHLLYELTGGVSPILDASHIVWVPVLLNLWVTPGLVENIHHNDGSFFSALRSTVFSRSYLYMIWIRGVLMLNAIVLTLDAQKLMAWWNIQDEEIEQPTDVKKMSMSADKPVEGMETPMPLEKLNKESSMKNSPKNSPALRQRKLSSQADTNKLEQGFKAHHQQGAHEFNHTAEDFEVVESEQMDA